MAYVIMNMYSGILAVTLYWLVLFERDELAWLYVGAAIYKVVEFLIEKYRMSQWWLLLVWEVAGLLQAGWTKARLILRS